MSESTTENQFELIFEGPVDESPETLRKLKGAFIADLELSIPEVQEILEKAPLTLKGAGTKEDLQFFYRALKNAGGKVQIISKSSPEATDPPAQSETAAEEDSGTEFTFEIDLSESLQKVPAPAKEPKVYNLEIPEDPLAGPEDSSSSPVIPGITLDKSEISEDKKEGFLEFAYDSPAPASGSIEQTKSADPIQRATLDLANELSFVDDEPTVDLTKIESVEKPVKEAASSALSFGDSLEIAPEEPKPAIPKMAVSAVQTDKSEVHFETEENYRIAPESPASKPDLEAKPDLGMSFEVQEPAPAQSAVQLSQPTPIETREIPKVAVAQTERAPESSESFDEQAEIEIENDPLARNPKKKTKPIRPRFITSQLPWEVIVPTLIGGIVLVLGNWFYFGGKVQVSPGLQSGLNQLADQAEADDKDRLEQKARPSKDELPPGFSKSSGRSTTGDLVVSWDGVLNQELLHSLSLQLTTLKPPLPTKEEIASGLTSPPWIYKIVVDSFTVEQRDQGAFFGKGMAKVYIEYKSKRSRAIVPVTIEGSVEPTKKVIGAKVSLTNSENYISELNTVSARSLGNGAFDIGASFELGK